MVGHGGSSASSYLTDPTSPIPSHCASIVATSTLRVNWVHFLLYAYVCYKQNYTRTASRISAKQSHYSIGNWEVMAKGNALYIAKVTLQQVKDKAQEMGSGRVYMEKWHSAEKGWPRYNVRVWIGRYAYREF